MLRKFTMTDTRRSDSVQEIDDDDVEEEKRSVRVLEFGMPLNASTQNSQIVGGNKPKRVAVVKYEIDDSSC
jgi:hypothetical protein